MTGHHRTDGKLSIDKEPIDSVTKTETNKPSVCLVVISTADTDHTSCVACKNEGRALVLTPSRSDLVVQSCFFFRVANREIYNLGMVSGPV